MEVVQVMVARVSSRELTWTLEMTSVEAVAVSNVEFADVTDWPEAVETTAKS